MSALPVTDPWDPALDPWGVEPVGALSDGHLLVRFEPDIPLPGREPVAYAPRQARHLDLETPVPRRLRSLPGDRLALEAAAPSSYDDHGSSTAERVAAAMEASARWDIPAADQGLAPVAVAPAWHPPRAPVVERDEDGVEMPYLPDPREARPSAPAATSAARVQASRTAPRPAPVSWTQPPEPDLGFSAGEILMALLAVVFMAVVFRLLRHAVKEPVHPPPPFQ